MGYEIKLYVGKSGHSMREHKRSEVGQIDGTGDNAYVYYPYLKDEKGELIEAAPRSTSACYGMVDEPGWESCRWITRQQQMLNTSRSPRLRVPSMVIPAQEQV